jgi:hypothetical protein
MHDHPLTKIYLKGATARDHMQMRAVMDIARFLEQSASEREIAACKLAAEVLIERSKDSSERLPLNLQGLD